METITTNVDAPQKAILDSLQRGERLTVQKAYHRFHTTELRKVISRLRKFGYTICANRITDRSADGRTITYNEYYMPYENA